MPATVVTELEDSGQVVVRKHVTSTGGRLLLQHEADVLAVAAHPGVVELIRHHEDVEGASLTTVFVGPHSLETIGPLPLEQAAGIVAALSETVADLHQVGVVHGRIEPSHVLIGAGGRPVLCGFGGGGRIGTSSPPGCAANPGFIDPAASDDAALTPQRDVYALGALLRALVGDAGAELEPIPDRRFGLGALRTPWSGYQRRALHTLIDRATDDAPLRRPPARRFAADLRETIPNACLQGDEGDPYDVLRMSAPEVDPRTGRHRAGLVTVAAGVVVLAIGINGLRSSAGSTAPRPSAVSPAPTLVTPTTTTPVTVPVDGGCLTDGPVGDDFDGDGCGDAVRVGDDNVVTVGTRRYAVGEGGDVLAVGDWDCDGIATPAVLRPSTGSIFVFDRWASSGPSTAQRRTTLPGAVDLRSRTGARGCATLVASFGDGTELEVT